MAAAPEEGPAPRGQRPPRRGSVTRYSLDDCPSATAALAVAPSSPHGASGRCVDSIPDDPDDADRPLQSSSKRPPSNHRRQVPPTSPPLLVKQGSGRKRILSLPRKSRTQGTVDGSIRGRDGENAGGTSSSPLGTIDARPVLGRDAPTGEHPHWQMTTAGPDVDDESSSGWMVEDDTSEGPSVHSTIDEKPIPMRQRRREGSTTLRSTASVGLSDDAGSRASLSRCRGEKQQQQSPARHQQHRTPRRNSVTRFSLEGDSADIVLSGSSSYDEKDAAPEHGDPRTGTVRSLSSLSALTLDDSLAEDETRGESVGRDCPQTPMRGSRRVSHGPAESSPCDRGRAGRIRRASPPVVHNGTFNSASSENDDDRGVGQRVVIVDDQGSVASGMSDSSRSQRYQRRGSVTKYSLGSALACLDDRAAAAVSSKGSPLAIQALKYQQDDRSAISEQLPPRPVRPSKNSPKTDCRGPTTSSVVAASDCRRPPRISRYGQQYKDDDDQRSTVSEQPPRNRERYQRRGSVTKYSLDAPPTSSRPTII